MEFDSFITKSAFTNLAGCIGIVEAFTESIKLLGGEQIYPYGSWIAFIFSVIISIVRFALSGDYTKDNFILSLINIVTIFLGSVGVYQIGIKTIEPLLSH